jgi:DNA-binding CsgD family transcriptional regulator
MPRNGHEGSIEDARLLEVIGDVCGLLDLEELRRGLLAALDRVLPSDYVSLNDVHPDPERTVTIVEPDAPADLYAIWAELAHENPLLRYYVRTLDGRANRFSDVISPAELQALELYRRLYVPMGVEYQMAFTLPAGPERVLAIALSRGERDYSDAERDFANRARPFLIQAYLNAIAFAASRELPGSGRRAGEDGGTDLLTGLLAEGLTRRESEVVRLVAVGRSNHHIAQELGISHRTVGKHLEHSFRKLGVGDRSSAATRAWTLAGRLGGLAGGRALISRTVDDADNGVLAGDRAAVGAEALEHAGLAGEQP